MVLGLCRCAILMIEVCFVAGRAGLRREVKEGASHTDFYNEVKAGCPIQMLRHAWSHSTGTILSTDTHEHHCLPACLRPPRLGATNPPPSAAAAPRCGSREYLPSLDCGWPTEPQCQAVKALLLLYTEQWRGGGNRGGTQQPQPLDACGRTLTRQPTLVCDLPTKQPHL